MQSSRIKTFFKRPLRFTVSGNFWFLLVGMLQLFVTIQGIHADNQERPVLAPNSHHHGFSSSDSTMAGMSPAQSPVINRSELCYTVSKKLIWGAVFLGGSLIVLVISLLMAMYKRKLAEKALRKSESVLRRLAENICEAFWLRIGDKILYVSPAFEKIFGIAKDRFIANPRSFIESVHPEDRANVIAAANDEKQNPLDHECRFIMPNNEVRWIRYRSFPIRNQDAPANYVAEVAEDITARKLAQDEMLRSQKIESIGLLAGGIAHDFNNLLGGIVGFFDLARLSCEARDIEKAKGYASEGIAVCDRARELATQLLTFSKGGAPIKKSCSLSSIIRGAAEIAMVDSLVKVEFDIPPDLGYCSVDEGQIRQALHNLLLNARQAMPTGGTIKVVARMVVLAQGKNFPLHDGSYLQIRISDDGSGIESAHVSKIFEPFFTTKERGIGLGLSTAYSIVKRHGGYLSAEISQAQGSTFIMHLPVDSSYNQAAHQHVPASRSTAEQSESRRILFVDDEMYIRKMAEALLKSLGYAIQCAESGDEAVALYEKAYANSRFDIVILDLTLKGGMDGKEVLRRIASFDPDVKALASSGYSDDPIMADPASYGFKGAVRKPYTREELAQALALV